MTLAEVQRELANLSATMLQAATAMERSNALLLFEIRNARKKLAELEMATGKADQPE